MSYRADEIIEIHVEELVCQTEKAGLFRVNDEEVWLPWSQVESDDVQSDGDWGVIYIPEWLAKEEGLI